MGYHGRQSVTRRFGIIKIAFLVGLQSHREFMKMLRYLVIIVEALVPVHFAITIEIVEHRQLISTRYIDFSFNPFDAQGLKQARRDSLPTR